ncbi:hypothetical protein [Streptosporangium sp. NPDC000396]|uniref:hypothetical protein n=1 Tax=Streptosporangium sp. NPDC000396 TaxID=3366185 RepID=UPI0036AB0204
MVRWIVDQGDGSVDRPVAVIASGERRPDASLLMLMAKPRDKKTENLRRYFHPSPEATAEVTGLLGPGHLA